MVQISSFVTLLAMGSSIMASPMASSDSFAGDVVAVPIARDNSNDADGKVAGNINASFDTSLRASGGGRGSGAADMAAGIVEIAGSVFHLLSGIHNDIERRKQFTQDVVKETAARYPGHNVVVCNVGYSLHGDGWQQVTSVSYEASVGHDVTFDVVVFNSPKTFERHGHGGYQNWAYMVGSHCHTNGGYIDCPRH